MNENRNNSYLFSPKESSALVQTCTKCCPYDKKNHPHPFFNYPSFNEIIMNNNTDKCCLNKLQVECRIQHPKKKRKQSISSSNQFISNRKRKKFDSNIYNNDHYHSNDKSDTQISSPSLSTSSNSTLSEQSYSSNQSGKVYTNYHRSTNAQSYDDKNLRSLKTSIDNLTQLFLHQQRISPSSRSFSLRDKFHRFFNLFKWFSQTKEPSIINDECYQILQRNHITKEHLRTIYHLCEKNETIFLNWLRTIIPESFHPFLLNYVKYFDSISTDNNY